MLSFSQNFQSYVRSQICVWLYVYPLKLLEPSDRTTACYKYLVGPTKLCAINKHVSVHTRCIHVTKKKIHVSSGENR